MNESIETLREKFEQFCMTMHDSLDALKKYVATLPMPEPVKLDYSLESLDSLEQVLERVLDNQVPLDTSLDLFLTRTATYMGETLQRNVGGHWVMAEQHPDDISYGLPCLTAIPNFPPDYEWCPLQVVNNFRYGRRKGLLRSATQAHIMT